MRRFLTINIISVVHVLFFMSIPPLYAQPFVADANTVALYHFDHSGAVDTLYDFSGNGNHGVISGAVWDVGKYDSALSFDGVDDDVYIPDVTTFDFSIVKQMTIEGWIKLDAYDTVDEQTIVSKWGSSGDSDDDWSLMVNRSGYIRFDINSSTTTNSPNTSLLSSEIIPLGVWVHVAGVWNGNDSIAALFIDGKPDTISFSAVPTIAYTSEPVRIGGVVWFDRASFDGNIDEMRISDTVRYPIPMTLAHYTFDEMSGDTLHDVSGNGNHGVISGATWVPGLSGGALQFDGIDDYVALPSTDILGFSGELTIEFLVYLNSEGGFLMANKNFTVEDNGDFWFTPLTNSVDFIWYTADNVNTGRISSNNPLPFLEWSHVALVLDDSADSGRIYINYTLDKQFAFSPTLVGNSHTLYIGGEVYNGVAKFSIDGSIGEIRISDRALEPEEFIELVGLAVKFEDDVIYGAAGDTISIAIMIDDSSETAIYSAEFDIGFDSTIITAIGVDVGGTLVGDAGWSIADTVKAGHLKVAMAGNTPLGTGNTLINIVLYVNDGSAIGAGSPLQFTSFLFNEGIPASFTTDGSVTVRSIYGDVSENGEVHAFDASLILAYLANDTAVLNDTIGDTTLSETRKVVADVSGNDTIATYDAHLILEYVATIRDCFPVECPESPLLAFGNLTLNDMVVPVVGDPFIYPVEIDGGSNIVSFEMEFEYDEDYLQFMNDITLTQLTQGFMINFNHEPGKVKLFGASESSDGSDGDFVFLSFVLIQDSAMIRLSRLVWNENDPETDVDIGIIRAVTGVEETGNNIPKEFALNQNYPNPFNPVTTIQYALPKRSDVTLTIYNLLGKEVERISELNKQAGYHEYVWDASHIATGVYFYRLRAGDFVQTRKMVLLK